MMKSKKIVLWGREDLLSLSVELLLMAQKGWDVINVSHEESFDTLIQVVDKTNPDIVIFQQGDLADKSNLPVKLLQEHPGLKVIIVSPNSNLMEVYGKQNVLIKSVSDFTSMIETDLFQTMDKGN